MMENMSKIRKMDMGYSIGKAEIYIKAVIKMMKEMDMGKCIGLTDHAIRGSGNKGFSMDKEEWYFQMELSKKDYLRIMFLLGLLLKVLFLQWVIIVALIQTQAEHLINNLFKSEHQAEGEL